jgi:hypothetical protein
MNEKVTIKKRITIENPGAINSLNMCMSGHYVEVIYLIESLQKYIYRITYDKGTSYLFFSINRYIRPDKNVLLRVEDANGGFLSNYLFPIEQMKNRNKFLDWLVKRAEEIKFCK